MLTIYTLTFNEQLLIQFMIDHYRVRFPGCHIVIYDNSSTDKTVEIALANMCEVRNYNSGGTLDDGLHMRIKNSCWKDAKTDWVLICDIDELVDIDFPELKLEEKLGTTIIKHEAWTVVNLENNYNLHNMKYGVRDTNYDKAYIFNKKHITDINYGAGAHKCNPLGNIKYSSNIYIAYHYKCINIDYTIEKSKTTALRLSNNNIKNNWGHQCLRTDNEIREEFEYKKKTSTLIPIKNKTSGRL